MRWNRPNVLAVLARHLLPGAGGPVDPTVDTIVWSLRAPRVVVAAMVGGCLALAGAQMQGLFRNPLASPGIVGTSTGGRRGCGVCADGRFVRHLPPRGPAVRGRRALSCRCSS